MIHQGQKPIDALQILVKSLVLFGYHLDELF